MIQLILATDKVISRLVPGGTKPGDAVWARDEKQARELLETGVCRWPEIPEPKSGEEAMVLQRPGGFPMDRFSFVRRAWAGQPVVCIGGGPSVTKEAVELCRGRARVVAINNSYLLAPWADLLYFADAQWWDWHREKKEFKEFAGQMCTIEGTGLRVADPRVHILHNYDREGLSDRPNGLHTGSNSGYQVINICALAGASPILLLGYDMRFANGKSHWHGGHPVKMPEDAYKTYARLFKTMLPALTKMGVEVINCTPGSAIDAFKRGDLAEELSKAAPSGAGQSEATTQENAP